MLLSYIGRIHDGGDSHPDKGDVETVLMIWKDCIIADARHYCSSIWGARHYPVFVLQGERVAK